MSESLVHQTLVKCLFDWLSRNIEDGHQAVILCDLPREGAPERPPQIGGFVPDTYCKLPRSGLTYVGEAKTTRDLETERSRRQLEAFLSYLAQIGKGVLVVAVPWHTVNRARSLVRLLKAKTNTSLVEVVILDQLPG